MIRPSVMGFHDGVVSITVMMLTLLSSGSSPASLVKPGLAAAFSGALSMALAEYSSVSAAWDNGIKHESPHAAGVSSFLSFALGSSIPILVVSFGGGTPDLIVATFALIALSSLVSRANVPRTVSIATLALVISVLFGRVLSH